MRVRKFIKDHIVDNGPSSEAELIAACQAAGAKSPRAERIIQRMTSHGKLVENGGTYTLAV